jgi:hypothetical protein
MRPCTLKLDEEKSTYAGLAQENGFLLQFCGGWYKAQQSCAPAREESSKYDVTAAPCF